MEFRRCQMLMTKKAKPTVTTAVTEAHVDSLDALRNFLAGIPRDPALQLAERNLTALRDERVALVERQAPTRSDLVGRSGSTGPGDFAVARQLDDEVEALDKRIYAAKTACRDARAAGAPNLIAAVAPHRAAAAAKVIEAAALLRDADAVMFAIDREAAMRGIEELPAAINVPSLEHLVGPAKRLADGGAS
jgi:hypothetical protein